MAFERDFGTCCCFFPLKFGVGLICALYFSLSVINILALFTGDIRFQGNGYNLTWYWVPSIVGAFGLIFGFVGLLGVYDDKPRWMRAFNYWLLVRLIVEGISIAADFWTLGGCEGWLDDPAHTESYNPQMWALADQDVCKWARWAYSMGCSVDLLLGAYFTYCSWLYMRIIERNPPYAIDFGLERYDVASRWKRYKARTPSFPPSYAFSKDEESVPLQGDFDYGSVGQQDDLDGIGAFGPDGMQMTAGQAPPNLFEPASGMGGEGEKVV